MEVYFTASEQAFCIYINLGVVQPTKFSIAKISACVLYFVFNLSSVKCFLYSRHEHFDNHGVVRDYFYDNCSCCHYTKNISVSINNGITFGDRLFIETGC